MSRENVEIVRRIYQAPMLPDGVEQILEFLDPDVEWVSGLAGSLGASYRGHSGVRQWAEDMLEVWEEISPEPIEFTDAGDFVVVDVRTHGRGRASSIEVDRRTTQVWTFRAGKLVRFETFTDRELALVAAGFQQ